MNGKIFCAAPFKALYVDKGNTEGSKFAPCCRLPRSAFPNANTFDEYINHPELLKMKQQFKDGEWPDMCAYCRNSEYTGSYHSPRLQHNRYLQYSEYNDDDEIVGATVCLSNVCNLSCGICSSVYSYKKAKEEIFLADSGLYDKSMHWESNIPAHIPLTKSSVDINDWLLDLLPNLKGLALTGGEPFLYNNADHLKILNTVDKSDLELSYSTNGTVWPADNILEQLAQVKYLKIVLSADGIGDQFEYARQPGKWDAFLENVGKWEIFLKETNNPIIRINTVISAHTVLWTADVLEWAKARRFDAEYKFLSYPKYFNIQCFPLDVKQKIVKKLLEQRTPVTEIAIDEMISWINKTDSSHLFPMTQDVTAKTDEFTTLNYAKMFPNDNDILQLGKRQ